MNNIHKEIRNTMIIGRHKILRNEKYLIPNKGFLSFHDVIETFDINLFILKYTSSRRYYSFLG